MRPSRRSTRPVQARRGPLAESGLRVTDGGATVAAYDRTAGVAQQSWGGPRSGLVLTTSPAALYREIPASEAAFAKRALKSLGVTATWTLDPSPNVLLADAIPSPPASSSASRWLSACGRPCGNRCAGTLLANPKRGTVIAKRTEEAGGASWRVISRGGLLRRGQRLRERRSPHRPRERAGGDRPRRARDGASSDGLSAIAQDLRWEFGVQPAVTVPSTASTVDADRFRRGSRLVHQLGSSRSRAHHHAEAPTGRHAAGPAGPGLWQHSPRRAWTRYSRRASAGRDPASSCGRGIRQTGTVRAIRFSRVGNGKQVD